MDNPPVLQGIVCLKHGARIDDVIACARILVEVLILRKIQHLVAGTLNAFYAIRRMHTVCANKTPLLLPNSRSGLVFRSPKIRARIFGPPTCGYEGCHTARVGKAAPDFKHEGEFGTEGEFRSAQSAEKGMRRRESGWICLPARRQIRSSHGLKRRRRLPGMAALTPRTPQAAPPSRAAPHALRRARQVEEEHVHLHAVAAHVPARRQKPGRHALVPRVDQHHVLHPLAVRAVSLPVGVHLVHVGNREIARTAHALSLGVEIACTCYATRERQAFSSCQHTQYHHEEVKHEP